MNDELEESLSERRRSCALHLAVDARMPGADADMILRAATLFEEFLLGSTQQGNAE